MEKDRDRNKKKYGERERVCLFEWHIGQTSKLKSHRIGLPMQKQVYL